ncbi:peptide chain release factor N(5)-glutamine methyltransferase [Kaarinaea lacus]
MEKIHDISQALQWGRELLKSHNDSAALEAEILLCHCLKKNRAYLRTWPEKPLDAEVLAQYQQLLSRRQQGEPIAYITGYKEFWDLNLRVSPEVLIPRPETEHLVELALEKIPADATWHIADLGTGSGAIALAIAKERPHCRITATDQSVASLEVAKDNANANNIQNVRFCHSSWFEALAEERFNVIVSNPPYVSDHDPHLQQGDLRFEPQRALSSGPNGLDDIEHIIRHAGAHLIPPGWLLLEHGYQQGNAVMALLQNHGFCEVQCHSDYAQLERVSVGRLCN